MPIHNLFTDSQAPLSGERFDVLLKNRGLTIERIVSSAHITLTEYRQAHDEWVVLLEGQATLLMAGQQIELQRGDYLWIAAHTPHTVLSASEGALWLALHWDKDC